MQNKTVFGFSTQSLETLSADLARYNNGIVPGPKDIIQIKILPAEPSRVLIVHVELKKYN